MKYIRVKNWDKFQQYKDRNPKWIKVYRDLLDDYEFEKLSDTTQGHLIKIWLLAAKLDNKIVNDPQWIKKKISAKQNIDLEQLLTAGFIELYDSVQECTVLYLEEEERRGEEIRKEGDDDESVDVREVFELYRDICFMLPQLRAPMVSEIGRSVAKEIRERTKGNQLTVGDWSQFFGSVAESRFLTGDNDRGWKASFDWLVKKENFGKVQSGKYENSNRGTVAGFVDKVDAQLERVGIND